MNTEIKKKAPGARVPAAPAVQQVVYQSDVTPTANGNYIQTTNDVKANLVALDTAIHNIPAQKDFSISVSSSTSVEGVAKQYTITQTQATGGTTSWTIDIPKDMVVSSGQIVDKSEAGAWGPAGKYIELTLANATSDKIYINVGTLVDIYTTGSQSGDMVVVGVDNQTHQITATITNGTVTKDKLVQAVQDSLDAADSALQKADITEGATNGTISVDGTDVAVHGLGSAAYTASTDYATSAQGDKADSAVQGVKLEGAANALSLDVNKVATIPNAVATGTGETNGLLTAADKAKLDALATTYKPLQTAVADTDATTVTGSTTVVTKVTQNANGVISVEKGAIPDVVASTSGSGGSAGLMTAAQAEKLAGISAGGEVNVLEKVKVGGTELNIDASKAVDIPVDGTFDASTNKVATQSTVTDAIGGLDVNEYAQAAIDTTTTSGETTVKISGIKETDGKIAAGTSTVDLVLDGTYNASTNKIATQATVANKANKVTVGTGTGEATAGNFFSISSTGDLQDSGYKAADFQAAGSYKTTQTAVADPTASGNAIAFIDTISQNANGEVSVTKKTVDTDGSTLTVANSKLKVADGGIGTTQLANGAVETSKLAVLNSFQIRDTAQSGAYAGQVYTITIDNGILTITPNPAQSGS